MKKVLKWIGLVIGTLLTGGLIWAFIGKKSPTAGKSAEEILQDSMKLKNQLKEERKTLADSPSDTQIKDKWRKPLSIIIIFLFIRLVSGAYVVNEDGGKFDYGNVTNYAMCQKERAEGALSRESQLKAITNTMGQIIVIQDKAIIQFQKDKKTETLRTVGISFVAVLLFIAGSVFGKASK